MPIVPIALERSENRLLTPTGDILPTAKGTLTYCASYLALTRHHSTVKIYLAAVRNLRIQ